MSRTQLRAKIGAMFLIEAVDGAEENEIVSDKDAVKMTCAGTAAKFCRAAPGAAASGGSGCWIGDALQQAILPQQRWAGIFPRNVITLADATCCQTNSTAQRMDTAIFTIELSLCQKNWASRFLLFNRHYLPNNSGFNSGNKIASRILSRRRNIMHRRSMPMPSAGGKPCSSVTRKSSSDFCCSPPA